MKTPKREEENENKLQKKKSCKEIELNKRLISQNRNWSFFLYKEEKKDIQLPFYYLILN